MARRSDHSKEQIAAMALNAAEKIVAQHGVAGLSARKVAAKIGYTVGTLYLVFDNIDDLILQLNARTLDWLYEDLKQSASSCRQPRTSIIAIGRAYVDFASRYPNHWKMIFEHNLPKNVATPDWYKQKVDSIFQIVEQQIDALLGTHSPKKISQIATTLWCGVHGICALAITGKLDIDNAQSIQVLTDSLINNFLAGISAADGK